MTFKEWWKEYCLENFAKECSPEHIYEEIWDAGCEQGFENGLDAAAMQDIINKTRGLD